MDENYHFFQQVKLSQSRLLAKQVKNDEIKVRNALCFARNLSELLCIWRYLYLLAHFCVARQVDSDMRVIRAESGPELNQTVIFISGSCARRQLGFRVLNSGWLESFWI